MTNASGGHAVAIGVLATRISMTFLTIRGRIRNEAQLIEPFYKINRASAKM